MARILSVDDDATARLLLAGLLTRAGHRVLEASDGERGLALARSEHPDLAILDIRMPKLNGIDLCDALRESDFDQPILLLTACDDIEDRVRGLKHGADDYLVKPFDPRELLARVEALLRRHHRAESGQAVLEVEDVTINLREHRATRGGEELTLTKTEWSLLAILAKNPGTPVSRERMLDSVWGYTYLPSTRTIDTHIWRLRRKLGLTRALRNVHGSGYTLQP